MDLRFGLGHKFCDFGHQKFPVKYLKELIICFLGGRYIYGAVESRKTILLFLDTLQNVHKYEFTAI